QTTTPSLPTAGGARRNAYTGTAERQGWQKGLRIFVGYSGWSPGQLEQEISENAWLVIPPARELIEMPDPHTAWQKIMRNSGPLLHLLSEAPDNPELN
ncbi:MAG: YqgE/AlgH family protein, partial [bacterium]